MYQNKCVDTRKLTNTSTNLENDILLCQVTRDFSMAINGYYLRKRMHVWRMLGERRSCEGVQTLFDRQSGKSRYAQIARIITAPSSTPYECSSWMQTPLHDLREWERSDGVSLSVSLCVRRRRRGFLSTHEHSTRRSLLLFNRW